MPTVRIPLVGTFNQRGLDGNGTLTLAEDQRFLNCTFNIVQNPVTGKATVYVEKRPGWGQDSVVSAGNASTGMIKPQAFNATLSAFGATNSTIYLGTISVGTITGRALHFTETVISSTAHVMIKSSDGTGWYFPADAANQTAYTGDTHTNTVIDNIASTTGMYIGQALSGTGLQAGTRITAITSSTAITVTPATTATNAAVALTKEPIAKILDSDFITTGTYISAFAEMDGYLFYTTDDGNLRNSDLNSVTSYTSTGYIAPNMSPDPPRAVARHKNMIICFGGASKEAFFNAGNATGSPLQRSPQFFDKIGVLDQRSVATLENDIYFVSAPTYGDVGVYRIRDMAAIRISTPNVDRIIGTAATAGGAIYASGFRLGGYPYAAFFVSLASDGPSSMLLLENGDNLLLETGDMVLIEDAPASVASFARLLVYNAGLNIWSEWDSTEATFISGVGSTSTNQVLATSRVETGGKVYRIDPVADGQLYRDDGSSYSMEVRTSRIDFGTSRRKTIKEIRLICDKESAGTASISWSDDDFGTYSNTRDFHLNTMQPKVTRCGSFEGGRSFKLTHSSNAPFRAEALEIDYEVGT